ncbi:hypothetical protein [Methylobacterium sp. J-070]|uniref:hypothetical protein n=1 Tax=Methylobacterium sp. J-070 TaxID=2836650 RepID=UPI001FB8C628|nr:hypothetical protein [Methylobacterium sp. J-070]MCJ2054100.1 hypothetical protein [Methylobacterium sp. J-070]
MTRHVFPTRQAFPLPAAEATPDEAVRLETRHPTQPMPLRLWVLSDLRVDLNPFELDAAPPRFDAAVVAGGICPGLCDAVLWLARALDGRRDDRPVILVPGPVEFCDGVPVGEALARAVPLARELGITLLHDTSIRLGDPETSGVHILGATLWPDFAVDGTANSREARAHARHRWSIKDLASSAPGIPFLPHDAAGAHHRSRAYIEDALSAVVVGSGGYGSVAASVIPSILTGDRVVVATAYPPSRSCLPPDLAEPLLDPWRVNWHASDLDAVMQAWGAPAVWVHGNVPAVLDRRIGRTRVVSNPRNRGDPTSGFEPFRTILV